MAKSEMMEWLLFSKNHLIHVYTLRGKPNL